MIQAILVILGCFILRAWPRLILRSAYVSDTYLHLYCASVIRESKFHIPQKLPRVLLPHRYTYPYLYHLLLAVFPLRYRLWVERLSGALLDTLSLIVIWIFSSWVVRVEGHPTPNLPLIVCALFAFSPALLRIGSGPRAYNGSPRPLGMLLYLTHLCSTWAAFQTQNIWMFLLGLVSGAGIFFSAKFATQVLLFFGVFFSIFISPDYLVCLIGCLLLAVLLTRRRVLAVLEGHFLHSLNYYKTMQKIYLYPGFDSHNFLAYVEQWKSIRNLFHLRSFYSHKEFTKNFMSWFYQESLPVHLFVTVFPQYFFIVYYGFRYASFTPLERFLAVWMAGGLFYFLFTKVKPFLFLGEGERYLEFALFPSLFLFVSAFYYQPFLWGILFLYSVLSSICYIWLFYYTYHKHNGLDYYARKEFFEKNIKNNQDVILPIGPFHWFALLFSNNPVVTPGANLRPDETPVYLKVIDRYPFPSKNYREIIDQYHVAYVISSEVWIKRYKEEIVEDAQDFDTLIEWLHISPLFWLGKVKRNLV